MPFEEKKARELTSILLNEDIILYKRYLPTIEKMDSKTFEQLFTGNKKYFDEEDKSGLKDDTFFNKLLEKFNNYASIFNVWYLCPNYYKYMKELWKNYICVEDLLGKNEKDVEKLITEKTNITYKSWPSNIKEEFLNLITGAFNTIVKKMKDCYNNLSSFIKDKLKEINNFSNYFHNNNFIELGDLADKYYLNLIEIAVEFRDIPFSLIKKAKELVFPAPDKIIDITSSIKNYCKSGWKQIFNSKLTCGLYAFTSFFEVYQAFNRINEVKNQLDEYKKDDDRLNQILKNFNDHKEELKLFNDSFPKEMEQYYLTLNHIKTLFEGDLNDIKNLILKIKSDIEQCKKLKEENSSKRLKNGIKTGIGIIGAFATCGLTSFIYLASAAAHGYSTYLSNENINNLEKNIYNLEDLLQRAKYEEKIIEEEINSLKNRLKIELKSFPIFFE